MKTWTDTNFELTAADNPCVTIHKDAASLHLPGFCADGRGFSLRLLPAHLPQLRKLCAALEAVAHQAAHTDHDPLMHNDPCPACIHEAALEDARQDADAERYADVPSLMVNHDSF